MTRQLKNFMKARKRKLWCECQLLWMWRSWQFCGCNVEWEWNNWNNSNSYPIPDEFKKAWDFWEIDAWMLEELNTFSKAYVNHITSGKVLTIEKEVSGYPYVPFYVPNIPDIDLEWDWDNSMPIIESEYNYSFVIEKAPFDAGEPALVGSLGFEPEMYSYNTEKSLWFFADPVNVNWQKVYVVKEWNGYKFELR